MLLWETYRTGRDEGVNYKYSYLNVKTICVTGGAGYKGAVLIPKLLARGHKVRVVDLFVFGRDFLPQDPNLELFTVDIRDQDGLTNAIRGCDTVIHMACISNDPSFALNPELSKTINFDAFEPLVTISKASGVDRFIYVSTSSVYGVSDAPDVTEESPLVPLTDYNKYKGMCEPILRRAQAPDFTTVIIRPATVCGYSPRQRLDLAVNILTNLAVNKRKITIFGGSQKRPNVHIEDITDLYVDLVDMPSAKIAGETFNAAYKNHTVAELGSIVKDVVEREMPYLRPIEVETSPTDDLRSYHVNSDKIKRVLGWTAKRTIEDAVVDLCRAFRDGKLPNSLTDPKYFNVKAIQESGLERMGKLATTGA
jgi:nucleoside-diphosphate-sugar epimerase